MMEFSTLFEHEASLLLERYENLIGQLKTHFNFEDDDEIAILLRLQEVLSWNSARKKLKPLLIVTDAMNVERVLVSSNKDPPRLVIIRHEDGAIEGKIVADKVSVACDATGKMFDFIMNLQAVYYAWDLSYPRSYQVAAFLQLHVLQDTKEFLFKSSGLTKLEKSLKLVK